jgi:predicted small lipoprotein YifL
MNLKRSLWKVVAAAGISLALAGCEKGPLEKAGKAVDRAADKAGDKIRDIVR